MATAAVLPSASHREFNEAPKIDLASTVHAIPPVVVHDTPVLDILDASKTYGDFRDGQKS